MSDLQEKIEGGLSALLFLQAKHKTILEIISLVMENQEFFNCQITDSYLDCAYRKLIEIMEEHKHEEIHHTNSDWDFAFPADRASISKGKKEG